MFDSNYQLANAIKRDQNAKADKGKIRMELIPTTAFKGLGRVLTFGAEKYGDNTWQGVETERYIGALLRHICAYIEDPYGRDEESRLYHTEHILANAMFLNHEVMRNAPETPDPKV